MDSAVGAELLEKGMGGEVGGLAVFEDEDAIGGEPARLEDKVGKLVKLGEVVGRVGEDEVEGCGGRSAEAKGCGGRRAGADGHGGGSVEIAEDVASDKLMAVARDVELSGYLLDELLLCVTHFDADDMGGATAEQFEADAACAAEEVERSATIKVYAVLEDVEESLLCQVGGRPGVEVTGRVESASAVLAGDDLQINNK